jgi:ATP-dependent Clp protease ATP-binding subunit ClpA
MKGHALTDGARLALAEAREVAGAHSDSWVGPAHILVGLLATNLQSRNRADTVLRALGTDPLVLQRAIFDRLRRPAEERAPTGPELPYTVAGRRSLELAMDEARSLGVPVVGSEHLLLGILRLGVDQVPELEPVIAAGVTYERAVEKVRALPPRPAMEAALRAGFGDAANDATVRDSGWRTGGRAIERVACRIDFAGGDSEERVFRTLPDLLKFASELQQSQRPGQP